MRTFKPERSMKMWCAGTSLKLNHTRMRQQHAPTHVLLVRVKNKPNSRECKEHRDTQTRRAGQSKPGQYATQHPAFPSPPSLRPVE
jgi:hypothetical protein